MSGISSAVSARRCHDVIGTHEVELVVDLVQQPEALADPVAVDLAGDQHHRRRGRERGGQARSGVVDPDAGHDERHPGTSTAAGVAVGQVGGALLVARGDELDRRLVVQPVDRVHGLVAGKAEHVLHALADELAGEGLATRHAFGGHPFGCHRSTSSAPGRSEPLPKMYTISKIDGGVPTRVTARGRGGGRAQVALPAQSDHALRDAPAVGRAHRDVVVGAAAAQPAGEQREHLAPHPHGAVGIGGDHRGRRRGARPGAGPRRTTRSPGGGRGGAGCRTPRCRTRCRRVKISDRRSKSASSTMCAYWCTSWCRATVSSAESPLAVMLDTL